MSLGDKEIKNQNKDITYTRKPTEKALSLSLVFFFFFRNEISLYKTLPMVKAI